MLENGRQLHDELSSVCWQVLEEVLKEMAEKLGWRRGVGVRGDNCIELRIYICSAAAANSVWFCM